MKNKIVISESLGANTFRGIRELSQGKNKLFFELTSNEKKVKHFISLKDRHKFRFILGKDLFVQILHKFPQNFKAHTTLSSIQSKFETACGELVKLLYEIKLLSQQKLSKPEKIIFKKKLDSLYLEASLIFQWDIEETERRLLRDYNLNFLKIR